MTVELFPFQEWAVKDLCLKAEVSFDDYKKTHSPQIVSLQAPTGSGKTIIMVSFVENILFGSDGRLEQPEAIFVWLSDSPQLNEQSMNKFLKSDKISESNCILVKDDNFDQETFDDGKIYFINTQKIGKTGNLASHKGDSRQYTIWETIENTAREKSDRLYFIIDEAHRGMLGEEAGKANTIMQRFLKGAPKYGLTEPVPFVIGISATVDRFNKLVGSTTSTLRKTVVNPEDVRSSGLLKERIVIIYPEDFQKYNEIAVLEAATDEWLGKVEHWDYYCKQQHSSVVDPVLVIQVKSGTTGKISDTNLDDVVAKIEERCKFKFKEGEVVHTFGDSGTLILNGLKVEHVNPVDIADDHRIKVVLFKENLSTGWDCPRAETMMSFRKAEDVTYIAQLLGRMIRTPLQRRVMVDEYLNDVRLFLPYFDRDNVQKVINELQSSECGDIPAYVEQDEMGKTGTRTYTVHTNKPYNPEPEGPMLPWDENSGMEGIPKGNPGAIIIPDPVDPAVPSDPSLPVKPKQPVTPKPQNNPTLFHNIDREGIVKHINMLGLLTYEVRPVKRSTYLSSMLSLATLFTHSGIDKKAKDTVTNDVVEKIHSYINKLHSDGLYEKLCKQILTHKLGIQIFNVVSSIQSSIKTTELFTTSDSDLDSQVRAVDSKLGGFGLPNHYGIKYGDINNPDTFKIDCILYALDDNCIADLNSYSEKKFHELNDNNRIYIVSKDELTRKQYSSIVANGDTVSKHNFTLPEDIQTYNCDEGKEYNDHLFAEKDTGKACIKLDSTWEYGLIVEEELRSDFVCWLRNQPGKSWALTIPYEMNHEVKAMYPDFIIIRSDDKLGYVIDILEPHNSSLKDNLPKAIGLAKYAENEQKIGRVQLIREGKDPAGKLRLKRLDFSKGEIRNKVLKMQTSDELDHLFDTDGFFS